MIRVDCFVLWVDCMDGEVWRDADTVAVGMDYQCWVHYGSALRFRLFVTAELDQFCGCIDLF